MEQWVKILFAIVIITRVASHQYELQKRFLLSWRKALPENRDRNFRRQDIITSIKPPTTKIVQASKPTQGPKTSPSLLTALKPLLPSIKPSVTIQKSPVTTQKPSVTLQKPSVTLQKPSVTLSRNSFSLNQPTSFQTSSAATVKENQHFNVPEPVDVSPVLTAPSQKFIPVPTTLKAYQNNIEANKLNRTHFLLPNLPVYNVSARPHEIKPVIPVKEVPEQTQIKTEMNPVEPLPVMTRPTVTILQHVIAGNPTQATLQSVVVPKRRNTSPPPFLTPLPVLEPQTVAPPMKPLKPLAPLPPQEPHIIHHLPIIIPTGCSDPCG